MTNIAMERSTMFNGTIHENSLSMGYKFISTLNYQRVVRFGAILVARDCANEGQTKRLLRDLTVGSYSKKRAGLTPLRKILVLRRASLNPSPIQL